MDEDLAQTDDWVKVSKHTLYRVEWGMQKRKDSAAPFLSFIPLLKKWLELTKPKLILEWGPGTSTIVMLRECPSAQIHSIEHDIQYYAKAQEIIQGNPNVRLYYIPLEQGYTTAPLTFLEKGKFDFVFVDGRKRVECLRTALKVVRDDAVFMLHDSARDEYAEGKRLFKIVEEADGTAVMKKL